MDLPPTFPPPSTSSEALRKKANSRRATKACLKCRRRKVRCDVTRTGGPCTNCRLDDAECEVASRAPRKFEFDPVPELKPIQITHSTTIPSHDGDDRSAFDEIISTPSGLLPELDEDLPLQHVSAPPAMGPSDSMVHLEVNYASSSSSGSHGFHMMDFIEDANDQPEMTTSTAEPGWMNLASICSGGMVEDRVLLDVRGCFMVPAQPVLDEFIDQYFLHVHPLLPMIGDGSGLGDLLNRNSQIDSGAPPSCWISGLLVQAVLFAASPYVADNTIKALGYSDFLSAKQSFYERAKLLFDFDTELDHVIVAQAALLLSYWNPNPNSNNTQQANTAWLRIALEHARAAGVDKVAQHENTQEQHSVEGSRYGAKHRDTLQRLWWCCIIRDRVMSLCTRRGIHITRDVFDIRSITPLKAQDLAQDTGASRVLDDENRGSLACVFVLLTDLCVAMTDASSLVFPAESSIGLQRQPTHRHIEAKSYLSRWSQKAAGQLGPVLEAAEFRYAAGSEGAMHVILQANLLRIYYNAIIVALNNHEIQLATRAPVDRPTVTNTVREMCNSAVCIVDSMQRLIELKLVNRLPSSVVACIALPFALHIMSVKHYESLHCQYPRFAKALKASEERLAVLMEAMKECNAKYEGVEWISEVTLAALPGLESEAAAYDDERPRPRIFDDPNATPASTGESVNYLTDLIIQNPLVYVRLSMTLDLGLRLEKKPQASDFPQHLQLKLFPGLDDLDNSRFAASVAAPEGLSLPSDASVARERLISDWVEVDRSLSYLCEIGLAP